LAARLGMFVQDVTGDRGESVSATRGLVSASKHNLGNVSATIKAVRLEALDRRMTEIGQDLEVDKQSASW
jgi:hypothetical protein